MPSGKGPWGRRPTWQRVVVIERSKLQRTIGGTAVGNFMEWYDFGIFAFLATTLSAVFFPQGTTVALIATFAIFAVAFVVRQFGGFFFGPLADRIGRKRVLTITITMMALATFAMGCLPGYDAIGPWAFVLLILARVVQGFSTGGEYADAMVYVNEHSPDRRRGFWASWLPVGTLSGYITGAGLVTLLSALLGQDAFQTWGWRIPFLLSLIIGMVGLYIRLQLEESPAYQLQDNTMAQPGRSQFQRTVVDQWRSLLVVIGLVMGVNVSTYMLTYLPAYLEANLGVDKTRALLIILIVLLVLVAVVTQVARLSDRIGRRPLMFIGSGLTLVAAIPALLLMQINSNVVIFLGALLIGLMLLSFTSVEPSTLPTLFPTEVRGGSVSVGYNISVSAFGGTTPLIAQALVSTTGLLISPAFYLMLAGLIAAIAVWFTPEPAQRSLPGDRPAAADDEEARQMAAEQRQESASEPDTAPDQPA